MTFLPTLHTPQQDQAFFVTVVVEQEVWVAERAGRILGFAALSVDMLNHLYVEPTARSEGLGSQLLDQAKHRRPQGFTFWVFQQNQPARQFYEHRDCRLVMLTDGRHNEEQVPDALYEWRP